MLCKKSEEKNARKEEKNGFFLCEGRREFLNLILFIMMLYNDFNEQK